MAELKEITFFYKECRYWVSREAFIGNLIALPNGLIIEVLQWDTQFCPPEPVGGMIRRYYGSVTADNLPKAELKGEVYHVWYPLLPEML